MRFIAIFLGFIFSLTTAQAITEQSSLQKIRMQLQWKHQFEFAGYYAAQEKGFYKEVGLDVEFIELKKTTNTVDEVLHGNANYGIQYSSLLIDYIEGKPLVMIANIFKQSPLVLVTHKNIKTPADLKGKRVGIFENSQYVTLLTMLKKFGVNQKDIKIVPDTTFELDYFISGKVDAIGIFTTNELYELNQQGVKFNLFDPVSYGTKFYDQNLFTTEEELKYHPQRVENFRNASIRGWEYALKHKEEIVEIILKKYNTQGKSKEALMFEARQIESLVLPDIYEIGSIDSQIIKMMADHFVQSGYVVKKFNTNMDRLVYKEKSKYMKLTQKQKEYLNRKREITMCVDPNWMPLEMIENSVHVGISSEYMKLVSQKVGIPIKLIATSTWSESLRKGIRRECDILAMAEKTLSREKYFDFTAPYIEIPIVIATKTGMPFMDNLEEIKMKRLGMVRDYSARDLLHSRYAGINLVEVESIQEGLAQVREGKLFGFLDNSIVLNHEIYKNRLSDIAINGQFKDSFKLSIATRNDEPLLHEIFEEALASVDEKTKNEIMNRWVNIRFEQHLDYTFLWQVLLFTLMIVSIIGYWNFKLMKANREKEKVSLQLKRAKNELEALNDSLEERISVEIEKNLKHQFVLMQQKRLVQMGEMIENIAHQWRQPLAQVNSSVLLIDAVLSKYRLQDPLVEEKLMEIESLTEYMSKTIDNFKNFFNPDKQKKRFNLRKGVEDSLAILKGALEVHFINIEIDIDEKHECQCYLEELQQVIVVIVNNAKDAIIATKIGNPKIIIAASRNKEEYRLSICDNGGGIPIEIMDKIFEPYFTTKHKSQGTGVGLYMAKMIVENGLGRELSVYNTDTGACFEMILPAGENV